jgi:2-keto-4-pentenoate hydratase/2-oxohepta-3-ene-1,7-dioic acid hydratase in catechol pathway
LLTRHSHVVLYGENDNTEQFLKIESSSFSLNIGDYIFTGTPAGVGECVVGDELEAFLENESLLKLEVK